MVLRAKKPETIKKRLKLLMYGNAGVGKTMAALQFIKPYLIDTEHGAEHAQYTEILEKQGGVIYQTQDYDDLILEIRSLMSEKHEYKTLIIDSLTIIYNNQLDIESKKVGDQYGKSFAAVNKKFKYLFNLLRRLDMNVIITAHSKNEYGEKLEVTNQTYDCYKKTDFELDLLLEIKKEKNKRIGVVKKTRLKTFPEGDIFDFSYEEIAKRYGKDNIERNVESESLATKEQVNQLKELCSLCKVDEETINKWLLKSNASSFEEMNTENIIKCIDYLKNKSELLKRNPKNEKNNHIK